MALALAYVNELLNQVPSTVVVDEPTWQHLLKALKFEGRALEDCVLGRMKLRWVPGGWDGLLARLKTLTQQVETLTKQLEEATAPNAAAIS